MYGVPTMFKRASRPLLSAAFGILLSSVFALNAQAMPEDANQPIHISADKASMNDNTGMTVYTGNVMVTQGSMKLEGARIEMRRGKTGGISTIVTTGSPARLQQRPSQDKPITHAYGKRMIYHVNNKKITIEQDARVEQGKDVFTGQRIIYNMQTSVVNAFSSDDGSHRVEMVIQPQNNGNGGK